MPTLTFPRPQVAIVFYQNILCIPTVYGVTVPEEWYRWLSVFNWANLDIVDIYDSQCFRSVKSRLNVTALGGLIVVLCLLALGPLCAALARMVGTANANGAYAASSRQLVMVGIPWALFTVFAFVPGVSRSIFRTWSCKKFLADYRDGSSIEFLVMHMSVQCGSDEHRSITLLSTVYLFVWYGQAAPSPNREGGGGAGVPCMRVRDAR